MHTIIATCMLCCIAIQSKAQPFVSIFGTAHTEWIDYFIQTDMETHFRGSFQYEKDTMANGLLYKKVNFDGGPILIREDTTAGTVAAYCPLTMPAEVPYLDLTLQKGDYFFVNLIYSKAEQTVDSVYTENGRKHIRFACIREGQHMEFIEGVGSNLGVDFHGFLGGPFSDLYTFCQFKDDQNNYRNPDHPSTCFPEAIDQDIPVGAAILFPDPVQDKLFIQNAAGEKAVLSDMTGRCLLMRNINADRQQIDMSNYPTGLYLLRLTEEKGNSVIKKIQKE